MVSVLMQFHPSAPALYLNKIHPVFRLWDWLVFVTILLCNFKDSIVFIPETTRSKAPTHNQKVVKYNGSDAFLQFPSRRSVVTRPYSQFLPPYIAKTGGIPQSAHSYTGPIVSSNIFVSALYAVSNKYIFVMRNRLTCLKSIFTKIRFLSRINLQYSNIGQSLGIYSNRL